MATSLRGKTERVKEVMEQSLDVISTALVLQQTLAPNRDHPVQQTPLPFYTSVPLTKTPKRQAPPDSLPPSKSVKQVKLLKLFPSGGSGTSCKPATVNTVIRQHPVLGHLEQQYLADQKQRKSSDKGLTGSWSNCQNNPTAAYNMDSITDVSIHVS